MNLAALKNKPIARPPKGVKVTTAAQAHAEAQEEPHPAYKEEKEGEVKKAKEVKKAIVVDKTKDTTLDRDIIMKRLIPIAPIVLNRKKKADFI